MPPELEAAVVVVDEVSQRWSHTGAVAVKGRFARKMVVCPPCRRSITGK